MSKQDIKTEHQKAKEWRKQRGLTLDELANLTGYASITIYWMERGQTPPRTYTDGKAPQRSSHIKAWIWRRYKLACAGVEAQLHQGEVFDWEKAA